MLLTDTATIELPADRRCVQPVSPIDNYLDRNRPQTPVLVVDLAKVAAKYRDIRAALPRARVFYAVKANPLPELVDVLAASDSHFDVASMEEVRLCLAAGIAPERLSFGNTIKKSEAIAFAHRVGVRLFAADCVEELRKIARHAPGASVCIRLLTTGEGAEWPLSRKFGCGEATAVELFSLAASLGLVPWGLSFHVGSQQTDPEQWDAPIATAARIYDAVKAAGITPKWLNLGGGFPASYRRTIPSLRTYGLAIEASLARHFGDAIPNIAIEPGRCLVAEAGVIETEVVLVGEKDRGGDRWVYLDCGKFGGLAETIDEAIQYPLQVPGRYGHCSPAILAGPTCDSADILYEKASYLLPDDLCEGDRVRIGSAGAYTHSYSAVGFNGFAPLRAVCIGGRS